MFQLQTYGEYSGAWRCSIISGKFETLDAALAYVKRFEQSFARQLWRVVHNDVIVAGYGK